MTKQFLLLLVGCSLTYAIDQRFADYLNKEGFAKSAAEIMGNVNIVNAQGETPLMFVARQWGDNIRTKRAIEELIKSGANVNYVDPNNKRTALLAALRQQSPNWNAAEALLDAGANPNVADENGTTPLMVAANQDIYWIPPSSSSLVHKLLQKGANKNAVDIKGKTAGNYAADKNKPLLGVTTTERPLPLPPLSLPKKVQPTKTPVTLRPTAKPAPALNRKEVQAYLYMGIVVGDEDIVKTMLAAGASPKEAMSPVELAENLMNARTTGAGFDSPEKVKSIEGLKEKYKRIYRELSK